MYTHSYGRHGPNAWRKWRERRFGSPAAPTVVVLLLRVPPTIERVVFVLMSENERGEDFTVEAITEGHLPSSLPVFSAPQVTGAQFVRGTSSNTNQSTGNTDPTDQVGGAAYTKGLADGKNDHNQGYRPSSEELDEQATDFFIDYSQSHEHEIRGYDPALLLSKSKSRYREGYLQRSGLQEKDLPAEWVSAIYRRAYQDKERDERAGSARADDELLAQAIDNALDSIGIHTSGQKRAVKEHMSHYLQGYREYIPRERFEQERSSFRPFRSSERP